MLTSALTQAADEGQPWKARWIGLPSSTADDAPRADGRSTAPNTWCCFRQNVSLADQPRSATARIACDSKYWLWVNGQLVVFEGQLKRGPTPQDTYFDRVELAPHLQRGENVIAVLVWYFGKQGMSHHDSGQLGLVFEAEIEGQTFVSDGSWKVRQHPAYEETAAPHPNWRLPESNVRFDARRNMGVWQQPDFDDAAWDDARELGQPPAAPWNQLLERPIPFWKVGQLTDYVDQQEETSSSGAKIISARLPYNAQITPYLRVDAPAGKVIDIRTDNYRGGGEFNVRTEYVTTDGLQDYESLGWMNGHQVLYTIPPDVEVLRLAYRESGYDTDFAGSFACDDQFLNRLWQKARRTLYLEMRDGYVDCPGRERAQWWGDITLELLQACYALDRRSDLLTRKAMNELIAWQRSDGTIFSPVPAGNWDKELPLQMLASVGRYGFGTYYRHTGDRETIRRLYPGVRRYVLDVWQLGDDGLVVPRTGGWTWGDWGDNKDMPLLYNSWYYLALDGLQNMAALLDKPHDVQEAESRQRSIRENFNKRFWKGSVYRSDDYPGETDERGHALAVVTGLADESQYPAIRDVFRQQHHASPYMEKYVLEALFRMGYEDDAIARIKLRYQPMVDSPLSTLWEGWGIGQEGFGGGSYNHAWSGGPLILLSQYVAGVAPLEAGYARYQVLPQMGMLVHVATTVPTVRGIIQVELQRRDRELAFELTSPDKTLASVGVPAPYHAQITANGSPVWSAGAAAKLPAGVLAVEEKGRYVQLTLAPGDWRILGRP